MRKKYRVVTRKRRYYPWGAVEITVSKRVKKGRRKRRARV